MKLWLLEQDENTGYDTYDAVVVAAETAEEAVQFNPGGIGLMTDSSGWGSSRTLWESCFNNWAHSPEAVKVTEIGIAAPGTSAGVILASFNAG